MVPGRLGPAAPTESVWHHQSHQAFQPGCRAVDALRRSLYDDHRLDDNHDGVATDRPPGVPRNSLQGPFYADFDLRWWHDFLLEKSKKEKGPVATIGLDAFNVINRVNYTSFVGDISSPFFGRAVSAQPPRRLQASFRLRF